MNSLEALVDRYCRAWNEADAGAREALLREALTPEATYSDPSTAELSIDRLTVHIGSVMSRRPGALVRRTSGVDVHHDVGRFNWHVVLPDGTSLPEGIDFIELEAGHRRIRRIVGFFGPLARK